MERSIEGGPFCLRAVVRWFIIVSVGVWPSCGCGPGTVANVPTSKDTAGADGGPVPVKTLIVVLQDLDRTIEMPGTIEGYESAELYAKVGGYVDEVAVDIGDTVVEGQKLAQLDIPEMVQQLQRKEAISGQAAAKVVQAKAAVRQAEAQTASFAAALDEVKAERAEKMADLELRQARYAQYADLFEKDAVEKTVVLQAKFELDAAEAALGVVAGGIRTAEAQLRAAEAARDKAAADVQALEAAVVVARREYELAQTMLGYATITAPFDGEVTRRLVHRGAFVQPAEGNSAAQPLFVITRTDKVRVAVRVPLAEVRLLHRGDAVSIHPEAALPGEQFRGSIDRFSAAVDEKSRMIRVEIDLDNPDGRLRPGYYAKVELKLQEPQIPVIPVSALATDGEQRYVLVVDGDGVCRRRNVSLSYEDNAQAGIADGLEAGERIVVAGVAQIQDGQEVRAEEDG